ncbi:acyl-CoA dehydrogenase family protein [Pseudofrankia inefficax]|uniref:Acyl-CoA dehydrogenase domain-containing protein n=1 Tax=Pseudofrankia inefficax (strain DSM 45817 / CECT 9037 / DDB 130130 / EuI1c) TaxID=298654 RepID=E3J7V7_PSEI1|nr:acyl-CoA dehydrogenase family protein [Pseudofrankia inefficax]ADP80861.1 acyl-CoA dehydrogenase domain-containing protein [Pseudofrankia inefficax]
MDLDLSDDQRLFQATTRKFLAARAPMPVVRERIGRGVDGDLLTGGAELGWTSMLVPEDLGGGTLSGEGVRDLGIVAEELGGALLSGPVLPTNVVAYALARAGAEHLAKELLPLLVTGQETATWAICEPAERWCAEDATVSATRTGTGFRLDGVKTPVQDADAVDHLLVTVRTAGAGATQLLVDAHTPGVTVTPLEGLDLTRRYSRVRFDGVEVPPSHVVGEPGAAGAQVDLQFALTLALQCAETVGATDRLYGMTLQYVKDRKAFGRPIGSYQALKHRLAEMLLWLESAKAATSAALAAAQSEQGAPEAASLAKAYVADRCPAVVRDCLQMHGGIGFTWEHDLHLFLRRTETNAVIFGGVDYHLDRLATAVGF